MLTLFPGKFLIINSSLELLITLVVKGLFQIANKSHSSICLDQGCRLVILALGASFLGLNWFMSV